MMREKKGLAADAGAAQEGGEYQMKRVAVGFTITEDYWDGMTVTRMAWAWEAKKLTQAGYWRDGGVWPWLRFVRKAKLDDYFYGSLGENKLRGLEGWMEDKE